MHYFASSEINANFAAIYINKTTVKKFLFVLLAFVAPLFTSCGGNDEDVIIPEVEDNYYVKYEAHGHASHIPAAKPSISVTVNTPDGIKEYKSVGASFSQTYGPVRKGFTADIKVGGAYYMDCQIYVSINQEPSALKAEGTSKATYTIN